MRKRQSSAHGRWTEHTGGLSPLRYGDRVHVQNQHGHHPGKWDHTGVVTEVPPIHRQDGRQRPTDYPHRRHLRRNSTPHVQPSPDDALRTRLAGIPPRQNQPVAAMPAPQPPPTPTPPTPPAPVTPPLPAPHQPTTPGTPQAPPPAQRQTQKKLQFSPPPTQAGRGSYASVAGTPPTLQLPPPKPHDSPAIAPTAPQNKPLIQPPPLRRSTRIKVPRDRYGH